MLREGKKVAYFHLRGALLCHLGHLCVLTSEHSNTILEAHYSQVVGNFRVEKIVVVL